MQASTGDPWEDEGFGGDDDWEGKESIESDVEDDDSDELDLAELDEDDLLDDLEPE